MWKSKCKLPSWPVPALLNCFSEGRLTSSPLSRVRQKICAKTYSQGRISVSGNAPEFSWPSALTPALSMNRLKKTQRFGADKDGLGNLCPPLIVGFPFLGSWSQCAACGPWRLPMNLWRRSVTADRGSPRAEAAATRRTERRYSRHKFRVRNCGGWRALVLSMNRGFGRKIFGGKIEAEIFLPIIFLPFPFPGSWFQCAALEPGWLPMNRVAQPSRLRVPAASRRALRSTGRDARATRRRGRLRHITAPVPSLRC
jgi:hypothetical protein